MNTGNPVFGEAFKRALYFAFIMAAGTFLTVITQTDDWTLIASVTGLAFLGPLGWRGIGEGYYDTNRAAAGKTIPGDVPMASPKLDVTRVP